MIYTLVTMLLSMVHMWSGSNPASNLFHILMNSFSRLWAYCLQSKSGLSTRATQTLARIAFKYSRSLPRRIAMSWYSWRLRAINSGQPSVVSCDAATLKDLIWWIKINSYENSSQSNLEARVSIGIVTTGVPVHSTSMLVVCPLHNGVSKQTSANWPRLTCSSFAATFEKIILPGWRPDDET